MIGYIPQVILAGRRINDSMAKFVAEQTIKHIIKADMNVKGRPSECSRVVFQGKLS